MDSLDVFLERELTGIEARAEVKKRVLLILAAERERCAAAERERCARLVFAYVEDIEDAKRCAAAIRKGE